MNIALAILYHYGGGKVDFEIRKGKLIWLDKKAQEPTAIEIEQWDTDRKNYLNSIQYQEDRVIGTVKNPIKYATLEEQEDMRYWDLKNGTNTWETHIDEVKATHKKPG